MLADVAADLRAALRGDCHSHTDASDGGSPLAEMVETARELGHEYLVITDHSPRLTVANGLSPGTAPRAAPRRRGAQRDARRHRLPRADGHRGRHPGRREPRPGARPARRAGRRRRERAQQAAHAGAGDDRADADRRGEPARRRPRPLHRPHGHRQPQATRSRSSTPTPSSPRAPTTASPSRSTHDRSGSTRRSGCYGSPSRLIACSRSTPTRTRPASSTGSTPGARGPLRAVCRRSGC